MDLDLQGKRALVTGASSGIGEAIAHRLAQEGAVIVVHGLEAVSTEAVVSSIRDEGGDASSVVGDLTDRAEVERIADEVLDRLGTVDILVNNAGGRMQPGIGSWATTTPADWATTYQLNVIAPLQLIARVLPQMRAQNWGRIIQIGSAAGLTPNPQMPDYSAAKAAVVNMTVNLSKELAGSAITSNCVSPGPTVTPTLVKVVRDRAEKAGIRGDFADLEREALATRYAGALGRLGQPHEIAATVALLASSVGGYYTGANLHLDGGRSGVVT